MAQMAKLEAQIGMQSSADKVYEIFKHKMYIMPNICPEVVRDVKVTKGDWKTVGSARQWTYVDGLSENTLETVEAIDDENKSITFNKLGGEIAKYYKTLKGIVTVTANGQGSSVKWTLMYEKQNQNTPETEKQSHNIPEPERYTELASTIIKSVDAYLLKPLEKDM